MIDKTVDKYLTEGMGKKAIALISTMRDEWDEMLGADAKQWTEYLVQKHKAKTPEIQKALKYFDIT